MGRTVSLGAVADLRQAFRIEHGEACRWQQAHAITTKRRDNPIMWSRPDS
jgi:hypothetical protein